MILLEVHTDEEAAAVAVALAGLIHTTEPGPVVERWRSAAEHVAARLDRARDEQLDR